MSEKKIRYVNVIPNVKIKQEPPSEDEDDVTCRICNKSFASEVALRNHARMEHIDAYATGDPTIWTLDKGAKGRARSRPSQEDILTKIKTEEMISSMGRTDLMSLANEDVSYIIIKADNIPSEKKRKVESEKHKEKDKDKEKEKERIIRREPKEPKPITGPFECLQPSTLVADGTCHQIFFSCCEYSIHFRDEHTRRRKGLRCQVCEKPLLSGGEEVTAPYVCESCSMGFQTSRELSDHIATDHVKLKPYECGVCHKRFTQQGGVQQHMRMHTGDRPFPCTFCPKAFTQKSGLDQHLRIHTKVKPYRCVVCSKTFCQSVHLKQHMRTHTNVAPFQCGICHKRFKQSSHLNYHLKNHNPHNMNDEQKQEYFRLISIMNQREKQVVEQEQVTVEVDTIEESEVMMDHDVEEISEEQILAEQSIQICGEGEGEETYILSDTGNEVWSVQLEE